MPRPSALRIHELSHCSKTDKLVKEAAAGHLFSCRADMATGNGTQCMLQHMGKPDAWQHRTHVIMVHPSSSVLSHGFNHHGLFVPCSMLTAHVLAA